MNQISDLARGVIHIVKPHPAMLSASAKEIGTDCASAGAHTIAGLRRSPPSLTVARTGLVSSVSTTLLVNERA